MSRSPLAYPLTRSHDAEIGGAADLQTDVMRFMAILALCLVAIFALVQSIPLSPPPTPIEAAAATVAAPQESREVQTDETAIRPASAVPKTAVEAPVEESIVVTRPKWQPKYAPQRPRSERPAATPSAPIEAAPVTVAPLPQAIETAEQGFTLRFASDAALMRAVAARHVGLYAVLPGATKRMTVNESRVSFWDASAPDSFHEMESHTVPAAVAAALGRSGVSARDVSWGVTLPGSMKNRLDDLMREHRGGLLVIGANGEIYREASP